MPAQSPLCRRGRSDKGFERSPWMAFEVSATMTTSVPAPLVIAICDFAASNSSRAERLSNSAEYQPPTKIRPNSAELVLQRRAVARASCGPSPCRRRPPPSPRRGRSRAACRRRSPARSSLVQPIGLAPMRMLIGQSPTRCSFLRLLVVAARGVDLLPLGDRRHRDVPPEAAGVGRSDRDRCR